jgi:hypothetical protein
MALVSAGSSVLQLDPSHHPTLSRKTKTTTNNSKYSLGNSVPAKDMPRETKADTMKNALLVSKLKAGDKAFVRRSNGLYSYAEVWKRTKTSIVFTVSARGDTKAFDLQSAARYVRPVVAEAGSLPNGTSQLRRGFAPASAQTRSTCSSRSSRSSRSHTSTSSLQALRKSSGHGSRVHETAFYK